MKLSNVNISFVSVNDADADPEYSVLTQTLFADDQDGTPIPATSYSRRLSNKQLEGFYEWMDSI